MPRRPEDITIQEPPIQELTRQYSCLRKSCFSCLSFVLVIVGVSLVLLKLALGSQSKDLLKVPPAVSKEIPIYDQDSVEKITLTQGADRSKGVEAAAFLPKLVMAPILATFDTKNTALTRAYSDKKILDLSSASWFTKAKLVLNAPVGDHRDEIKITSTEVTADPKFISEYYITELEKRGFIISAKSQTERITQFTFTKNTIAGNLYIENAPETLETDTVILTVQLTEAVN